MKKKKNGVGKLKQKGDEIFQKLLTDIAINYENK